jgi:hypothetical protein
MTNYTPVRSKEQFYAATGLENMKAMLDDLGWTYQSGVFGLLMWDSYTDQRSGTEGDYVHADAWLVASTASYDVLDDLEFGESYELGGSGEESGLWQQS